MNPSTHHHVKPHHATRHTLQSAGGDEQLLTRKWADDGVLSNALNPGAIATGLQKHTGGLKTPVERRKTLEQGAATTVLLAASPMLDGVSGCYFEDCNEAEQVAKRPIDSTGGYAAYALDPENADRLWHVSENFVRSAGL